MTHTQSIDGDTRDCYQRYHEHSIDKAENASLSIDLSLNSIFDEVIEVSCYYKMQFNSWFTDLGRISIIFKEFQVLFFFRKGFF